MCVLEHMYYDCNHLCFKMHHPCVRACGCYIIVNTRIKGPHRKCLPCQGMEKVQPPWSEMVKKVYTESLTMEEYLET